MITLRYSCQKLQNVEDHHVQYHSKPFYRDYGLSKIVIHVYFYGPIEKQMFHNTSFLSYFDWKKCLWLLCLVWWIFRKNIKNEKFWPWLIFWPLIQTQFYRKEPHLVMLGHLCASFWYNIFKLRHHYWLIKWIFYDVNQLEMVLEGC